MNNDSAKNSIITSSTDSYMSSKKNSSNSTDVAVVEGQNENTELSTASSPKKILMTKQTKVEIETVEGMNQNGNGKADP